MSYIGMVLSGATTNRCKIQVLEEYERSLREGMFVIVDTKYQDKMQRILGRIIKIGTYNDFYEEGDIWSEARRKGSIIPENIARRYTIAEVELLGILPNLVEVNIPPTPGDKVLPIKSTEEILSVDRSKNIYIDFGEIYGYRNVPIPLSVEGIPMHMAFTGVTGSGKSYTFGYFIELLAKLGKKFGRTIPVIVIDANADYIDFYVKWKEKKFAGFNKVRRVVFLNSSACRRREYTDILRLDLKITEEGLEEGLTPSDFAEMIADFYKPTGTELQTAVLQTLFETLILEEVKDLNFVFRERDTFRDVIIKKLNDFKKQRRYHQASIEAAMRSISLLRRELVNNDLIYDEYGSCINWKFLQNVVEDNELVIFDFSADGATGVSLKVKQFVVAYLSVLLYKLFVKYKIENRTKYMIFAIEEAQNYCPNLSKYPVGSNVARKYIALIATQGRKFGLSLALITQRPMYVDPIAMAMINTFFIHRTAPEDINYLIKLLGGAGKELLRKALSLETGNVIIHGQMVPFSFPVLASVPRREIEPTMGKTYVSGFIKGDAVE